MSAEDLSPEGIAVLQKFKASLQAYRDRITDPNLEPLPNSKRGMQEYLAKLKEGAEKNRENDPVSSDRPVEDDVKDSNRPNKQDDLKKELLWNGLKDAAILSGAIKEIIRQRKMAKGETSEDYDKDPPQEGQSASVITSKTDKE